MPREILQEIINNGLYLHFIVILAGYFLNILVALKLGFRFLGITINNKKLVIGIITGIIYCTVGKQILSEAIFGFGLVILFMLLFKFFGGATIFKAFWAAFLVRLTSIISVIAIGDPLISFNRKIMVFLLKTPWGIAVGTLIELLFPAITLLIFTTFDISLAPPFRKRVTKLDFLGILQFGIFCFLIYNTSATILWSLQTKPNFFLLMRLIFEWIATLGAVFLFFLNRHLFRKKREQEQLQLQLALSNRLLETLSCEQREFRNRLQVMSMLATMEKTKDLNEYIFNVAKEMSLAKMINIENPVLASTILSQKIRAKEKGIELVIQNDSPLDDLPVGLVNVGMIINIVFDQLIENEIASYSVSKTVFLDIRENGNSYFLIFNNSEEAISIFRSSVGPSKKIIKKNQTLEDGLKFIWMAEELVEELGGECSYIQVGNYIVQFRFQFKGKNKKNAKYNLNTKERQGYRPLIEISGDPEKN